MKLVNVGGAIICAVLMAGCASHEAGWSTQDAREEGVLPVADGAIGILANAAKDYTAAREAGDGVAMARAAISRFDASARLVTDDAEVLLAMKTHDMLRQAHIVANGDAAALAEISKLIDKLDVGLSHELASEGRFSSLGSLKGAVNKAPSSQFETYALDAGDIKSIDLPVTATKGLIVYVEAPELGGIVLSLHATGKSVAEGEGKSVLCQDASQHGILMCRWRPRRDSVVKISIENTGLVTEPILMITNQ